MELLLILTYSAICVAYHFAIIRRILLRMRSWENFVFLEGHGGGGGNEGGGGR
jgi:hypothetical protein